ncbi:hypothetical protein DRO91_09950 [Candidatus Heimdallarchaeota archaeon]|nr:MAG: hypothetical protein DRO91_09950 [Candidatus Heimdallarchaeota archaeon]
MKNWAKKEVPNLEVCKKLKELGYPQNLDGWYWVKTGREWKLSLLYERKYKLLKGKRIVIETDDSVGGIGFEVEESIKAPTCRELGEWLPYYLPELKFLHIERNEDGFHYYYPAEIADEAYVIANNEANARAKIIIFLAENGYIKLETGDVGNGNGERINQ